MSKRILLYATMNWPSAARYAGGFVAAGSDVEVVCPARALVRLSRYVSHVHRYRPLAPFSSLRRAVARTVPDLIVACDDRAVAHLVRLHAMEVRKRGTQSALAALIVRSLGRPENYDRVISRNGSLAEVKALGVRVPETLAIERESDLERCLAVTGLPAVFKADGSWGGEGVIVARTLDEARAAWRKLSRAPSRLRSLVRAWRRRDAHFLLAAWRPTASPVCMQRFIPGRPAASAFAAQGGSLLAHFHYDVVVADGTIGPPNVIRRVDDSEMDAAARTVAQCFGLSGLHGLDFIRDDEGNVHLIEINPRATQGGTLPFGEGRDLPSALVAGHAQSEAGRRPAIENDLVAFFPREMRRDPASHYIVEGHHDIPSDDPAVLEAMLGTTTSKRRSLTRTIRIGAAMTVIRSAIMRSITATHAGE